MSLGKISSRTAVAFLTTGALGAEAPIVVTLAVGVAGAALAAAGALAVFAFSSSSSAKAANGLADINVTAISAIAAMNE